MKCNQELNEYIKEIKQYKKYTKEDNQKYFERYNNGEKELLNDLFQMNCCLVLKCVYKFYKYFSKINLDIMDLIQVGNLSLIKAIETYDLSYQTTFSTWACLIIEKDIKQEIITNGYPVTYHKDGYKSISKYNKVHDSLCIELGREPNIQELASALNVDERRVIEIQKRQVLQTSISLYSTILDDDCELLDMIEDKENNNYDIFQKLSMEEMMNLLKKINLKDKERQVIMLRYGFIDGKIRTYVEIAKQLNCSKQRVWSIEQNVLRKIRKSNYIYELALYTDSPENNLKRIIKDKNKIKTKLDMLRKI